MSHLATDRQINYIIDLHNKIYGDSARFFSQTGLGRTQREKRGDITKGRASELIDELKAELNAR